MWKSAFVLLLFLLILLGNLLLVNDYATPVAGAEAAQIASALTAPQAVTLPQWVSGVIYTATPQPWKLFMVRIPGVLIFLLGLSVWFVLGTKLFGRSLAGMAVLACGSMIATPLIVKTATADSWLLSTLSVQLLLLMISVKRPHPGWKIAYWISAIIAAYTAMIPTLLWALAGGVVLQILQPFRGTTRKLFYWPGWLLLTTGGFLINLHAFHSADLLWVSYSNTSTKGWLLLIVGMTPWIGFLPAALAEMVVQLKKREEMAAFTAVWLLAAVASGTAVLLPVIAFMTGRQALRYFRNGYPWGAWVKTGVILQQILLFLITFFLLLDSAASFGPEGYRQAMIAGLWLWAPGLGILIGLFGNKPALAWGSLFCSGLLPVLFALTLYFPLVESQRLIPSRLPQQLNERGIRSIIASDLDKGRQDQLQICLFESGIDPYFSSGSDSALLPFPAVRIIPYDSTIVEEAYPALEPLQWWTIHNRRQFLVDELE